MSTATTDHFSVTDSGGGGTFVTILELKTKPITKEITILQIFKLRCPNSMANYSREMGMSVADLEFATGQQGLDYHLFKAIYVTFPFCTAPIVINQSN
jgi:hypothetical protein